ncbi:hypothetical protein BGX28_001190 [Mortierella sp. GBA30]|nr:hypothetical protein BGX28_001190 [Mortierella sp. GBA30]
MSSPSQHSSTIAPTGPESLHTFKIKRNSIPVPDFSITHTSNDGIESLPSNAPSSPSARSSAPPPAIGSLDLPTTSTADRRASYIIPPIQFDEPEEQSQSSTLQQNAASAQDTPTENIEPPMIKVESLVMPSGSSSLRVKFKNRVNNKLASMRSSSNLREKAKDIATPQQQHHHQLHQSTSAQEVKVIKDSFTPDAPAKDDATTTMLYQQLQELKVEEQDSDQSLDIILPEDYEDYTQFAELPLKKRKKMERSMAASLAAADAAGSDKRPNSMRASADAVKRFLSLQQRQATDASKGRQQNYKKSNRDSEKGLEPETVTVVDRDIGPETINGNKKRPQSSTEALEGTSLPKKTAGHQAAEWRRSLLKSLHFGKGHTGTRKGSATAAEYNQKKALGPSPLGANGVQSSSHAQLGSESTSAEGTRLARSGSVRSVRAQSLTTATHPALLATTVSKPRGPGLRRETLEMAMRRRRQSSVVTAQSNIGDVDIPPVPTVPSQFFDLDDVSTTNITHTFTSFTLELTDMHHANEVMNNSVIPGLFNFKTRKPRLTVSSNIMMELDTDQEFKGFDSDGDAISGYTGDADVSMDDIQIQSPRISSMTARAAADHPKSRARDQNSAVDSSMRRKVSSVDGDSDTISELPTLMIRSRDLNRSNSGGRGASGSGKHSRTPRPQSGSSFDMDQYEQQQQTTGPESPRFPRRLGPASPTVPRKAGRGILGINTDTMLASTTASSPVSGPSSPAKSTRSPMSMEEIVSWKPRNVHMHSARPPVPALDTKPLKPTWGSGMSSTTLVGSSRTPHSGIMMTQSPAVMSPAAGAMGNDERGVPKHHYQQSSSSSSATTQYPFHPHQMSGDTLVPHHSKNFSAASTMSASSGFSTQTMNMTAVPYSSHHQQQHSYPPSMMIETITRPPVFQEYDPSEDFPPTTPADLKAMDFEALLATAEQEHQKEWEHMKVSKQTTGMSSCSSSSASVSAFPHPPPTTTTTTTMMKNVAPLKIANSASKTSRAAQQQQQQQQKDYQTQSQPHRNVVAFDLGPSDDGGNTGTGSDRSMRSKRVMKKKMSVIRLTGHGSVQGRREDDGVIRVSMSSVPPLTSAQHSHDQRRQ